ncbi:MAG: hypothetical protein IPO80_08550 [Propionibacteriaceae bacterium]|nr:hypothetical protein [Propionibacteriaceae bacterium]
MTHEQWLADHLGPVEIIAIDVPAVASAAPWDSLLAAVDAHTVRVLDLEFIHRTAEDEAEVLDAADLPEAIGFELPAFEGACSGLLDDDDIVELLAEIEVGTTIAVLLIEHTALLPTIQSFEAHGSRVIADGSLGLEDLEKALAATEDD